MERIAEETVLEVVSASILLATIPLLAALLPRLIELVSRGVGG